MIWSTYDAEFAHEYDSVKAVARLDLLRRPSSYKEQALRELALRVRSERETEDLQRIRDKAINLIEAMEDMDLTGWTLDCYNAMRKAVEAYER